MTFWVMTDCSMISHPTLHSSNGVPWCLAHGAVLLHTITRTMTSCRLQQVEDDDRPCMAPLLYPLGESVLMIRSILML